MINMLDDIFLDGIDIFPSKFIAREAIISGEEVGKVMSIRTDGFGSNFSHISPIALNSLPLFFTLIFSFESINDSLGARSQYASGHWFS